MQTCPQCRSQQLNGVLFCSECGASLLAVARKETTASLHQSASGDTKSRPVIEAAIMESTAPRTAQVVNLVVINSGRRITLDANDELLVGRKDNARGIFPDIDLGLDEGFDAGVSRRHAMLSPTTNGWILEDLGSANGTYLNGKRVQPDKPVPVQSGDELKFGTLLLRIEL